MTRQHYRVWPAGLYGADMLLQPGTSVQPRGRFMTPPLLAHQFQLTSLAAHTHTHLRIWFLRRSAHLLVGDAYRPVSRDGHHHVALQLQAVHHVALHLVIHPPIRWRRRRRPRRLLRTRRRISATVLETAQSCGSRGQ